MTAHEGRIESSNPNALTIDILQQMSDYYERTGDRWRTIAYRKAISQLKQQTVKICTKADAAELPGIGSRLADKIEEIVLTQRLQCLDSALSEPTDNVLQEFLKVYGIGVAQAERWIQQGCRTLEDLRKLPLTRNQMIGLDHYDDFNGRIPRAEMDQHDSLVRAEIGKIDPSIEAMIGGSYRRGSSDSGDVDFIITKPRADTSDICRIMLEKVIPHLFRLGYLQAGLAVPTTTTGSKWQGAATLPGTTVWRRIDFLFVPGAELGAALIYFTGNDIFNRSIRMLARERGMRLNQHGLWRNVPPATKKKKQLDQGELVEAAEERRIFDILGVPW